MVVGAVLLLGMLAWDHRRGNRVDTDTVHLAEKKDFGRAGGLKPPPKL